MWEIVGIYKKAWQIEATHMPEKVRIRWETDMDKRVKSV